jgi:amino acid transporter
MLSTVRAGQMTVLHFSLDSSGIGPFALSVSDNSVSWVMTDYDATAHITEEMRNPAIKAPISILAALGSTYILGFVLNIALSITMGTQWPALLGTSTGLPVAQILYNVLGNKGGTAFMVLAAAICNFTGASCLQAQARTGFALARGRLSHISFNGRRDAAILEIHASYLERYANSSHLSLG